MTLLQRRLGLSTIVALLLGFVACDSNSDSTTPDASASKHDASTQPAKDASKSDEDAGVSGSGAKHPLVILTERESTDQSIHYLHVLPDWPESHELDYKVAFELGKPGVMYVDGSSIYFWHAQDGVLEKFSVDDKLKIERGAKLAFGAKGIMSFDAEPIWVNSELAFMVDEKTGQIAQFNPTTMKLGEVDKVDPAVLDRDGLKVQFQLGIAAGSRIFTAVSWRDWETNKVHTATVLGTFNQDDTKNGPKLIEDERCTASVTVGPFADGDYVYAVGDGVNGFDMIANPNKSAKPQCVVRVKKDANSFDADYFIDLQDVTKSPAIFMAYPMSGHKLLVSMWNPDVAVEKARMGSMKADWFWNRPPYYVYAIIDLQTKDVKRVDGIPEGIVNSPKLLVVDDKNYVQTYRDDKGTDLHRVDTDGKVTDVLKSPSSANVQYLGRL